MIANIGMFILLATISYVLYKILPEIKIFLTKERSTSNINNITLPENQYHKIETTEDNQNIIDADLKNVSVEDKMASIFLDPILQDTEVNFESLGETKINE